MSDYRVLISDEEYDTLNMYEQMSYKWCEKCGKFYNSKMTDKCVCEYAKKVKEMI